MPLYHITTGRYEDYGTFAFIEAPHAENNEVVIREAMARFDAACSAHRDLVAAVRQQATTKFVTLYPPPPPEESEKFSELYPAEAHVLSIGKTHVGFSQAKTAEQGFLNRRDGLRGQRASYNRKQAEFIEEEVARLIPNSQPITLSSYLPEGFKVVEVEEIHFRDL